MESYVVRIYQRPEQPGDALVGVVEDVREGRQIPFHDMEELRSILLKKDPGGKRANPKRDRSVRPNL
jgi:hypothetical protein